VLKYVIKKRVGKVWIEFIWLFLRAVSRSWFYFGSNYIGGTKWRVFCRLSLQVMPFCPIYYNRFKMWDKNTYPLPDRTPRRSILPHNVLMCFVLFLQQRVYIQVWGFLMDKNCFLRDIGPEIVCRSIN
jgi:hypothetical protein